MEHTDTMTSSTLRVAVLFFFEKNQGFFTDFEAPKSFHHPLQCSLCRNILLAKFIKHNQKIII